MTSEALNYDLEQPDMNEQPTQTPQPVTSPVMKTPADFVEAGMIPHDHNLGEN